MPRPQRLRIAGWVGWIVLLTLALIRPLIHLVQHADQSHLHSYIPLVPLVAGYLLFTQRRTLPTEYRSSIGGAVVL